MFSYFIHCVGILIIATRYCFAYVETSSGTGGVPCGNYMCGQDAICTTNKKCACNESGNGNIMCLSSGYYSAFILNDPLLETYDGEHANLAIPCRYGVTEIKTDLLDDANNKSGVCDLHVRAFNAKDKGKFYLHGVDVALSVSFDSGDSFNVSVRKYGTANNGTYTYNINATQGSYNVDGPFKDDRSAFAHNETGLTVVECTIDKENNIAMINITHCGIVVYYRPYDIALRRNQSYIPGLGIAIKKSHDPTFVSNNESLALIPTGLTNAVTMADLPLQVSNTVDILYRAFLSDIVQNNPYPNSWCENATLTFSNKNTTSVKNAFNGCLWMLQTPKFIRCYDSTNNGEKIMELFDTCSNIFVGDVNCTDVQNTISTSGCDHATNSINVLLFMNGTYC